MRNFKKMLALGTVVVMLCVGSVTALAADAVTPAAEDFICQRTGEVCTLDHQHGTGLRQGAQNGTGAGLCCTLDHEHTQDCVLPGSGMGAGCGGGRRDGTGGGMGGGHQGRGRRDGSCIA